MTNTEALQSFRWRQGYCLPPWVFETPFLQVWNGSRFRSFRRLIRREKRLPLCHRCPDGG
jgi:hypothetical protein